jgi:thiol-disulfide isomerase/thioredoxin
MHLRSLAVVACVVSMSCGTRSGAIVAHTGAPELVDTSITNINYLLTDAEYAVQARTLASNPGFVPITKRPATLTADARFGTSFSFEEQRHGWAIDGNAETGYTFYGDFNGNGDLTDDEPRQFVDEGGKPTLRYSLTARATDGSTYPAAFKLVLDGVKRPETSRLEPALVQYFTDRRRGQLTIPGRKTPLMFRLTGRNGVFTNSDMPVSFDFDDDGKFDTEIERYLVSEKYVNVGGRSYEFVADRHGQSLTLTPLTDRRPDRVILKTGFPAPDFQFIDLAGATHRLSDYRGKVVLLDFWGVWCAACAAATPELVELYGKYHARGFDVVGIEARDAREKVAAFTAERRMTWAETLESDSGPIATKYRVTGWPTSFLVGPDGKFVVATYLGEVDLRSELQRLFPDR